MALESVRSAARSEAATDHIRHGTSEFRRTNVALFAAGVATFGLLYCVQPLMPVFSAELGLSAASSALSLSLPSGVMAAALLITGAFSDRWGRKPLMSVSLASSALLMLLTAAAKDWSTLLALRTVLGLTLSGVPAVAMAYLSEEMDPGSIGLGMGLYIGGSAVGGLGGRLLAGIVSDAFGWRAGLGAVGLIGLGASVVFVRSLPSSRHFTAHPLKLRPLLARFGELFADRGLPWMFLEGFILLGAFVTLYNYIGYRLMAPPYRLSQTAVGMLFSIYLVGTLSSPLIGHLAGRLGRRRVLWTMFVMMLAGLALTLAASLWMIIAGLAVVTFGFFGGHSVVSSWVGRRAGRAQAQASSMYLFAYYLGSSIAGAEGGVFYAAHGWGGVVLFVGGLFLVGLLVAWRLYYLPMLTSPPGGVEAPLP